jgi:hypothetical protein
VIGARGRLTAVALLIVAASLAGCSSSDGDSDGSVAPSTTGAPVTTTTGKPIAIGEAPLRIELIGDAIAAVEGALGGPQRYFEVNATPTLVNLFVAVDDETAAVAYTYIGGELDKPAAKKEASGPTFAAAAVVFDPERVLANVVGSLPNSNFRAFSVLGIDAGGADGVRYVVVIESADGQGLQVFVDGNGAITGTG